MLVERENSPLYRQADRDWQQNIIVCTHIRWPVPIEIHPFAIHIVKKKLEDIVGQAENEDAK